MSTRRATLALGLLATPAFAQSPALAQIDD